MSGVWGRVVKRPEFLIFIDDGHRNPKKNKTLKNQGPINSNA
jgi:hypothetical protein